MPRYTKWFSPIRFSYQNYVYISHLPTRLAHPANLVLIDVIILIKLGERYKFLKSSLRKYVSHFILLINMFMRGINNQIWSHYYCID
jgi:hypothetical protein